MQNPKQDWISMTPQEWTEFVEKEANRYFGVERSGSNKFGEETYNSESFDNLQRNRSGRHLFLAGISCVLDNLDKVPAVSEAAQLLKDCRSELITARPDIDWCEERVEMALSKLRGKHG